MEANAYNIRQWVVRVTRRVCSTRHELILQQLVLKILGSLRLLAGKVGSQVSGCGHLVTIFCESFHGFPRGGHTWVIPFQWDLKMSLLLGLGNGSTMCVLKVQIHLILIYPLGLTTCTLGPVFLGFLTYLG